MNTFDFHHLGLACRDFAKERRSLELLGYESESPVYDDRTLGIRCSFLSKARAPRLELVAPLPGSTVLDPWLEKGTKLYHMAFFTAALTAEIERLRAEGAKIMVPPTPAVAFGGKRVSFVMLPNLLLGEFIEQ